MVEIWIVVVIRSVVWGGRIEVGFVCVIVYCVSVLYYDFSGWEDMVRSRGISFLCYFDRRRTDVGWEFFILGFFGG